MRISNISFVQTYDNFGRKRRKAQNEPINSGTGNKLSSKIAKRFHEEDDDITLSDKVIDNTFGLLLIAVEKTQDVVGRNVEKALDSTVGKVIDNYRNKKEAQRLKRMEENKKAK